MRARPASDFTDLVFHALAWLAPGDASDCHDPRYLAWAAAALPPAASAAIAEDAPLLTDLYRRTRGAQTLHALPRLHASIAAFMASAARPLEQLADGDTDDPALLRTLRDALPDRALVEILRAALALCARAYAAAHAARVRGELAAACVAVAPWLARAAHALPALAAAPPVELAHALGPRGRALGDRLVIGAPAAWNDVTPAGCAVQAMHEAAVHAAATATAAPRRGYVRVEWAALGGVAHALARAGADAELAAAHRAWLARLSLAALARDAAAAGLVAPEGARAIVQDRDARQALLAENFSEQDKVC